MDSYFTEAEYADLLISDIDKSTPLAIAHVSKTQFSIARHYGGVTYKGSHYIYNGDTDELIRDDVLKAVQKIRGKAKKEAAKEVQAEALFSCKIG